MDYVNVFHAHLDECEQCREHPFNLCSEGERLLHEEVRDAVAYWSMKDEAQAGQT